MIRNSIIKIEAIELFVISLLLGGLLGLLMLVVPTEEQNLAANLVAAFFGAVLPFVALFGLWGLYLGYNALSRAGGCFVDLGLWWLIHILTAGISAIIAAVFDLNRWIMSKIFYRGEAPVEYAWSFKSKAIRKAWEAERKAKIGR